MPLKTRITDVRHNAETGCFEADVTLIDGTDSFTYAVEHRAPIDAETSQITAALTARARTKHRPSECTLTRRRLSRAMPDDARDLAKSILSSQPSYLDRILGREGGSTMRGA